MKIRNLILAAAILLAPQANAADLAVKAINKALMTTASPCTVPSASTALSCTGGYIGIGIAGQGSNADILGSGLGGSVFAGGMTPSVNAGYLYAQGNWIFGAELRAGHSFNTGASANGTGGSFNGFRITEDFQVGGNLAGFLGTQAPITVPASLAQSILGPYAHVGVTQWQFPGSWASANEAGAGVLFDFPPIMNRPVFGKLEYTYTNFNGAKAANGVTIQNDQSLMFSVNAKLN